MESSPKKGPPGREPPRHGGEPGGECEKSPGRTRTPRLFKGSRIQDEEAV